MMTEYSRVPPTPGAPPDAYSDDWSPLWLHHPVRGNDHDGEALSAFMTAIYQARKRSIVPISREAALALWTRSGGKCEVSGIPFTLERAPKRFARRPWAPSIDQIQAGKGYGLDNLRVVCIAVNFAMNHWGEDVLYRIAAAITERKS
jgi:hypothetical protein